MKITWLGHSSFLLESNLGTKILIDPFYSNIGYTIYDSPVNIVTISHNHFDHNFVHMQNSNSNILNKIGTYNVSDIRITGFSSYHDDCMGAKRGNNIIFKYEVDNYILCHLGDLGYVLSQEEINEIGKINVLFIPTGGNFTIDSSKAFNLCTKINSNIVIPMHYKTSVSTFPLEGVENFLIKMKNTQRVNSNTLEITQPLTSVNAVYLLDF